MYYEDDHYFEERFDFEIEFAEEEFYYDDAADIAMDRYAEEDYEREAFYALTNGDFGDFEDYDVHGQEQLFDGLGY